MIERAMPAATDAPRTNNGSNEISLLELSTMLLRHRWMILLAPVGFAVIVGGVTILKKRVYTANASFVAGLSEQSDAASLARQFGINLDADAPGQSPHFYADLVTSGVLLRRALESEYAIRGEDGSQQRVKLIDFMRGQERRKQLSWQQAIDKLRNRVGTSVNRQTGVVQVSASATTPGLAEQIAARVLELVNEFTLETRRAQAREESRFVADRMEEAREDLLAAELTLQRFLQRNRQFGNSPELLFEHDRLQRQIAMRQDVYTALVQSHDRASINAARDTRNVTVIDRPDGTAKPQGRGTVKRTLLALFFGLLGAVGAAVVIEFARRSNVEQSETYREFNELKRQAIDEIRNPRLWFRSRRRKVRAGAA